MIVDAQRQATAERIKKGRQVEQGRDLDRQVVLQEIAGVFGPRKDFAETRFR